MEGKQTQVFLADISLPEFYKHYSENTFKEKINKYHKVDKNSPYYLTRKEYSEIIKEFNSKIVDLMLFDAFIYKMPCSLGRISIRKKKVEPYFDKDGNLINKLPVNRKETKQLWTEYPELTNKKFVYHHNEHSDGYIAKLHYEKKYAKFVGKSQYFFKPTRTIKQEINKILTAKFKKYDFFLINDYRK